MIDRGLALGLALLWWTTTSCSQKTGASPEPAAAELDCPAELDAGPLTAVEINQAGERFSNMRKHDEARQCYEKALALARQSNDQTLEIWVRNNLGLHFFALARYEEALSHLERAVELARPLSIGKEKGSLFVNL